MQGRPLRVLIIQLARSGDLVQTVQALNQIHSSSNEIEFYLASRKAFYEPVKFLIDKFFSKIFTIDLENIFCQAFEGPVNLTSSVQNIKKVIDSLNSLDFDYAINLNFSKTSGYLASLIRTKNKHGLYYDYNANVVIKDRFSQYFYASVLRDQYNPFHLVDLFRNIVANAPIENSGMVHFKSQGEKIVTIHPFSSQSRKTWPINQWTETLKLIGKKYQPIKFIILGGHSEAKEAEKIEKGLESIGIEFENLVGKLSLAQTNEYISRSHFFIGQDSLCSHLAAISNIPSITIALGTVRPQETFPYQKNAIVISPSIDCFPCSLNIPCAKNLECHFNITPITLLDCFEILVDQKENPNSDTLPLKNSFRNVNIYKSRSDKIGYELQEISVENQSFEHIIRVCYRVLWSFALANIELNPEIPKLKPINLQKLKFLSKGIEVFYELNSFGEKFTKYLLEDMIHKKSPNEIIQGHLQKISEVDSLAFNLGNNYPWLGPLIDYFHVRKNQLRGSTVETMAESLLLIYQEAIALSSAFYEMTQKIILTNDPAYTESQDKNSV